jgi:ATP-dependent Clp protease ATP-binding subunit ClpB
VDFKNTVVIMTSNLGSQYIAEMAGRGTVELSEGVRRQVTDALRQHFRPEFINRIDEVIFFHALSQADIKAIIEIQVTHLLKRLEERKIHVSLSDSAKDLLVREGYDPMYGARPLKRALQRLVLDPLALRVLDGEFKEGDTVAVEADGTRLEFVVRAEQSHVSSSN